MPKYRVTFYDTALYYHEFETDVEVDLENDPYGNEMTKLYDDAWLTFNEPLKKDVDLLGDWTLSDDAYDVVKLED